GNGQRGVVTQGLADAAARVAGEAQAIVLGRDLGAVVGDVTVVVHDEVVAKPGLALNGQVGGGDAVAIDEGIAIDEADAFTDGEFVVQVEHQIGAITADNNVSVIAAEVYRAARGDVCRGTTLSTDVPALADIGQRVLDVGVVAALHGKTCRNGVRLRVVVRRSTQCCRYAGACGIEVVGQRIHGL